VQDKEVHILLEDQQKINRFARLNNRMEELKEDMKGKKSEIQTLEDASTDLMMMEDDDEKVIFSSLITLIKIKIRCPIKLARSSCSCLRTRLKVLWRRGRSRWKRTWKSRGSAWRPSKGR